MTMSPSFMLPPHEFAPTRGRGANLDTGFAGAALRLTGRHFDVDEASVRVGGTDAQVLARSPSNIDITVPQIEPGCYPLTIVTGGGSVTSSGCFEVVAYPVLEELDPFGFNKSPEADAPETMTILGQRLLLDEDEVPAAVCSLVPRPDPSVEQLPGSVTCEILSKTASRITVSIPSIPDFSRYVGGTGHVTLWFPDGYAAESDTWKIEGL